MQNLPTQFIDPFPLLLIHKQARLCILIIWFLLVYGCGAPIPASPTIPQGSQDVSGPILGPITKAKVIDRLGGYPICGMQSEEQKLTLQVRIYPLKQAEMKVSLVQIECFFFGVQGLYEFALITPEDGRVYPLPFQGAEPVKKSLQGEERRNPVALNQGRSEVCGVPQFQADHQQIEVTCKGDPSGGCGVYAKYKLSNKQADTFKPQTSYFKLIESRFHSCGQPMLPDISRWSDITP